MGGRRRGCRQVPVQVRQAELLVNLIAGNSSTVWSFIFLLVVIVAGGFLAFISYSIGVERMYLVGQGLEGCRRVLTVRFHH